LPNLLESHGLDIVIVIVIVIAVDWFAHAAQETS
jgi:hypothetical protein